MDDDTVRPSTWSHWTDMHLAWKVGRGRILADLGATVWSYDYTTDAYYDSHLADLELGYGWGEIPDPRWRALVTLERHGAGDSPDSYSQAGLQGGFESFGSVFSGTLAVEYGRRWYDHPVSDQDWREILESDDFLTRCSVLDSLEKIGGPSLKEHFEKAMKDEHLEVRRTAAHILNRMGEKVPEDLLIDPLGERDCPMGCRG